MNEELKTKYESTSDLYVSWSEYHQTIEQLAIQVQKSGWEFNQIICIAKGGLRVGDILSRLFEQPLAILSASSYGGEHNQRRGEIKISEHLSMTSANLGNKVLLVDDLADSGVSLKSTLKWLQKFYSEEITEIRTAVLWRKQCSQIIPDYYVYYLPNNPWIHQPFEYYERINPLDLMKEKSEQC